MVKASQQPSDTFATELPRSASAAEEKKPKLTFEKDDVEIGESKKSVGQFLLDRTRTPTRAPKALKPFLATELLPAFTPHPSEILLPKSSEQSKATSYLYANTGSSQTDSAPSFEVSHEACESEVGFESIEEKTQTERRQAPASPEAMSCSSASARQIEEEGPNLSQEAKLESMPYSPIKAQPDAFGFTSSKSSNEKMFCVREHTGSSDSSAGNLACMLCCSTFDTPFELQSHLVILTHLPREALKRRRESSENPILGCAKCSSRECGPYHACVTKTRERLVAFVTGHMCNGSPLTCILCNGKVLQSIHHLILHVAIHHGFRDKSVTQAHLSCPFCHAAFKTRNSFVVEAHALDVHLPELVLTKQRHMHPETGDHQLAFHHFSCYFENSRYLPRRNPFAKGNAVKDCTSTYSDLSGLIGHVCSAHYPVLREFQPPEGLHACKACLLQFANRTALRDHVLRSHSCFIKLRAIILQQGKVCFQDHCDPAEVCQFCFVKLPPERLQAHLLVYHVASWRSCGFCGRDFCGARENVSAKILFLTMERHVDHHARQLAEHFEEMSAMWEFGEAPPTPPEQNGPTDFFQRIEILDHKGCSKGDGVKELLCRLSALLRTKSSDITGRPTSSG